MGKDKNIKGEEIKKIEKKEDVKRIDKKEEMKNDKKEKKVKNETEKIEKNERTQKAKNTIVKFLCAVALIGVLYFIYFLAFVKGTEKTENAYIHGNKVVITSQINGVVSEMNIVDTEKVEKNQILLKLDKTNYEMAYENAKATLGEAVRGYYNLQNSVVMAKSNVKKAKAYVDLMEITLKRAKASKEIGAISLEEFDKINFAYISSKSDYKTATLNYQNTKLQGKSDDILNHPKVKLAIENLKNSYYNLEKLEIASPIEGTIVAKQVEIGEAIGAGRPIVTIVDLKNIWVEANFKETQLRNIQIGNPVEIESDITGKTYEGVIVGVSAGSGNAFSLIPSQNATGNWIKVVQRVPVRIEFVEEVAELPLGTTLTVKVNTQKKMEIPEKNRQEISSLYKINEKKFEEVVDSIIKENTL